MRGFVFLLFNVGPSFSDAGLVWAGIPYYPAVSAFQGGVVTINPSPQLKCAVHPDNVAALKRVRYFSELVPPPADAEPGSLPRSNQTRSSRAVS